MFQTQNQVTDGKNQEDFTLTRRDHNFNRLCGFHDPGSPARHAVLLKRKTYISMFVSSDGEITTEASK